MAPVYLVKNCPIRKDGEIVPIGATVELEESQTAGLEQFLELQQAPAPSKKKP